jgi:hypothetical protein
MILGLNYVFEYLLIVGGIRKGITIGNSAIDIPFS